MNPTTILHKVKLNLINNFETGITGKLYFDDVDDLKAMIRKAYDLKTDVHQLIIALQEEVEKLQDEE